MLPRLYYIVLYCADLSASRSFYEALGFSFNEEKHGGGPEHLSCDMNGLVLELYPNASGTTARAVRLGIRVDDLQHTLQQLAASGMVQVAQRKKAPLRSVVVDPDGNKIELTQAVQPKAHNDWSVWRQDDNGNCFLVAHGLDKSTAAQQVAEFTARGHKQTYWISEEPQRGAS